jgi:glycine/D-amino acid oxidase-like deaminating enzyme
VAQKRVIVIGGGMGGFITGALLAKLAGMEVILLEKESTIGGRTMSFGGKHGTPTEKEFRQILRGSSSVHVVSSQPSIAEIIDEHKIFENLIIDAGWHGVSAGNRSRYSTLAKALGKRLPCAPQIGLLYHEDGEFLELTEVVKRWPREDIAERNRVAALRLAISSEESAAYDHVDLKSYLEMITTSQRVRDYYGTLSKFQSGINDPADVSAGEWIRVNNITSSTGAHLSSGGGMGDVAGGFRNITLVFAEVLEEAGGEVRTEAKVTEVLFDGHRATGVAVEYGRHDRTKETLQADYVVSSLPMYDIYSIVPEERFPLDWRERIAKLQPLPGVLGHVVVRELLETQYPKGMFVVDRLPGIELRGGMPAFGFEQTTVIDPERVLNGSGSHLIQTWSGVWYRDPDEYHDKELIDRLVDAQLAFMRKQYPQFDDVLEYYIFVLAQRVYGVNAMPGILGDRRIPVKHPLIENLYFSGDTVEQTDYGTSGAAHGGILCANAVAGQNFLTLLPEMMR